MPKSGTTWLCQLLALTPGMVQLNKSFIRNYPGRPNSINIHDVDPQMLTCAPQNSLSFLKLHLNPYSRNFSILEDHNIKTVVLIRDLRDMLISRQYHVIANKSHWDNKRLMNFPPESRLLESMKGVIPELSVNVIDYFIFWVNGWIDKTVTDPNKTLLIKYEEMNSDLFFVLKKIYKFYEYYIDDAMISKIIIKQKKKHKNEKKRSLEENLKLIGRYRSTFRQGIVGQWQSEYNSETKDFVKNYAGDILIKSGYEKDLSW
tara:strand:+ start:393 stop:1172 length:780 start_codon:yes stop_codon:yes gene_type:complete